MVFDNFVVLVFSIPSNLHIFLNTSDSNDLPWSLCFCMGIPKILLNLSISFFNFPNLCTFPNSMFLFIPSSMFRKSFSFDIFLPHLTQWKQGYTSTSSTYTVDQPWYKTYWYWYPLIHMYDADAILKSKEVENEKIYRFARYFLIILINLFFVSSQLYL